MSGTYLSLMDPSLSLRSGSTSVMVVTLCPDNHFMNETMTQTIENIVKDMTEGVPGQTPDGAVV